MSTSDPADFSWIEGWAQQPPAGRDRRENERVVAYWESKLRELGGGATVAALDLSRMNKRDWWNRFLISVDPVIERSSLLLYGPKFARLLSLPLTPRRDLPMLRQLPRRYGEVFVKGCTDAQKDNVPVRLEGEVVRFDDRIEQYRAVFIPVGVKPNSLTCFAFGAFNNRVVEPA